MVFSFFLPIYRYYQLLNIVEMKFYNYKQSKGVSQILVLVRKVSLESTCLLFEVMFSAKGQKCYYTFHCNLFRKKMGICTQASTRGTSKSRYLFLAFASQLLNLFPLKERDDAITTNA